MKEMIRITKYYKKKEQLINIEEWLNSRGVRTERRWKHGNSWVALYREILPTDSKALIEAYRE